jgi:hypothetical protein
MLRLQSNGARSLSATASGWGVIAGNWMFFGHDLGVSARSAADIGLLVSIWMAVQWRARAVLPTYRRGRSMDGSPRVTSRDQALPAVCALPRDGSEDDVCPTAYYYSKHQETTDPTRRPR